MYYPVVGIAVPELQFLWAEKRKQVYATGLINY